MARTNSWDLYKDFTNPQDPEFQAKIRALAGMSMLIDPALARQGKANKFYRGMWTAPGIPAEDAKQAEIKAGMPLEQDKIYTFGDNNTPQIWAHEYRHRAGVVDEGLNRIYDAAMAGSAKKWDFAVNGYIEWMRDKGVEMSRKDAIEFLDSIMPLVFKDNYKSLPYKIFFNKEQKGMLDYAPPKPLKTKKSGK